MLSYESQGAGLAGALSVGAAGCVIMRGIVRRNALPYTNAF